MGVSTDAILGWGIALELDEGGWEPDDMIDALKADFGVELGFHGSDGYLMPYIGVLVQTANRGYPLKPNLTVPGDAMTQVMLAIKYFIDNCDCDPDSELLQVLRNISPKDLGWFLCSYWG